MSHASEDKARFVLEFATRLLENGIDAWLDKWKMHPGDSLVDQIFEIGIGGAEAILIVLSQNSVEKPWVREELIGSFCAKRYNSCVKELDKPFEKKRKKSLSSALLMFALCSRCPPQAA